MKDLETEKFLCNFIQGELWKEIMAQNPNEIRFPLFISQDDWESGNPLGPQAGKNKFCGVYVLLPCFPPHLVAQLDYILLHSIFRASDRVDFGNKAVFNQLIKEVNKLSSDGLVIKSGSKEHHIRFQAVLLTGDNLGLNEALGFSQNFAQGRPCRTCRATISEIREMLEESEGLLRTEANYEEDFAKMNSFLTGIKERCIFHSIHGFYVCINLILDIMHDIFEGVCIYAMVLIITLLIKRGYF